jgi:hypothetical protein
VTREPFSIHEKIVIVEAFMRGGRKPIAAANALPSRSRHGVLSYLIRGGFYTAKRQNRPWTMTQIRMMCEMWKAGKTAPEISEAVGHSAKLVYEFVRVHGRKHGLKSRAMRRLHPGEIRAIEREAEVAITRAIAGTGRSRGSVMRILVNYIMRDGSRQKRKAAVARITDLGGMAQCTPPGPRRKREAA